MRRLLGLKDAHDRWLTGQLVLADVVEFVAFSGEASDVLQALPPRARRDPAGLVLGIAAELAAQQPLEAMHSIAAARAAGIELELLDAVLAGIGLQGLSLRDAGAIRPATWLLTAAAQAQAVARIHARTGRFQGSGVLIDAGAFLPDRAGQPALLTAAHVCCDAPGPLPPGWPAPLAPESAEVRFPGFPEAPQPAVHTLTAVLWRSPVQALDACLLALDPAPALTPLPISEVEVHPSQSSIYLMGYPEGGPLALSVEQSSVTAVHDGLFEHKLGSAPGASGGPVFQWADQRLAGIHRGAQGDARQGVLLAALQWLAQQPT